MTGEMLVENFTVKMKKAGSSEKFLPLIPVDFDLITFPVTNIKSESNYWLKIPSAFFLSENIKDYDNQYVYAWYVIFYL